MKNYNKEEIEFYRECLKRELNKPLHKQDFMYMRYLDEIINKSKLNRNEGKNNKQKCIS
tara:strand:- start:6029 stop:6205 length:177 start_codon:yes stop_codon:yes gene_type:complete